MNCLHPKQKTMFLSSDEIITDKREEQTKKREKELQTLERMKIKKENKDKNLILKDLTL